MQQEPFAETIQDSPELTYLERGQYSMLLHNEISAEDSVFFICPGQDSYLYEYEGDLDEALDDLPEIYNTIPVRDKLQQPVILPLEAEFVIEQLWNHFEQTGTQELEGEQDYNFRIDNGWLLIVPKEPSEEVVAISRGGQVQSSFEPERYEHLMKRCAIAYEQNQLETTQRESSWGCELG